MNTIKKIELMQKGYVVQFNENHKWCGCLGIIEEVKDCGANGIRYMIGVPVPQQGTAYIYAMDNEHAIELIGQAIFVTKDSLEEEE